MLSLDIRDLLEFIDQVENKGERDKDQPELVSSKNFFC